MKMSCKIQVVPIYKFEELTEKQYKAIASTVLVYPNGYFNKGIQINGYGGKFDFDDYYHYTIRLDTSVINRREFEIDRADECCLASLTTDLMKKMDKFVNNIIRIIEENEEPVST